MYARSRASISKIFIFLLVNALSHPKYQDFAVAASDIKVNTLNSNLRIVLPENDVYLQVV